MKLKVQRLITVWIEETYIVDEINDDTIQDAICNNLECVDSETLWDTAEYFGSEKVYDGNYNLLRDE